MLDWPLRFEAYTYLGNRYRDKAPNFASELRYLWKEWIASFDRKQLGLQRIFWPPYLFSNGFGQFRYKDFYSGSFCECDMSMIRVKETLELGFYDSYFKEAKESIKYVLLAEPLSEGFSGHDLIWQIVRIPFL